VKEGLASMSSQLEQAWKLSPEEIHSCQYGRLEYLGVVSLMIVVKLGLLPEELPEGGLARSLFGVCVFEKVLIAWPGGLKVPI
jgi:hypothetical protein